MIYAVLCANRSYQHRTCAVVPVKEKIISIHLPELVHKCQKTLGCLQMKGLPRQQAEQRPNFGQIDYKVIFGFAPKQFPRFSDFPAMLRQCRKISIFCILTLARFPYFATFPACSGGGGGWCDRPWRLETKRRRA